MDMTCDSVTSLISMISSVVVSDSETSRSPTPYLDSKEPYRNIAYFQHNEVSLGGYVKKGRFTEMREVRKVEPDLHYRPTSFGEEKARLEICDKAKNKGQLNFCIKRLRNHLKTEKEIERAILGLTIEASYLSRLDHPNIVQLQGLCQAAALLGPDIFEYKAIIVNRLTETLDERINYWNEQESLSVKSDFIVHLKTDYAFQIADALDYLHDRRIVLRNLNLSSIGFTSNDTIQLVNFDCAKEIPEGQDYLQDGFKGHQAYMALEMYSGEKYDFKADCYAFAICFYEMLTQKPAFQCDGENLIREHGWCPSLEQADFVPDGILDLLEDAWEADLDDRLTMKDIRGQLEWILFGEEGDDGGSCTKSDHSMEASNYLNLGMEDFSALGLDLDESELFCLEGSASINAALGFSGTKSSFIPEHLLLDSEEATAHQSPSLQTPKIEAIFPKIEYTQQYRGLRQETIPPLSFVPQHAANKSRRRRSIEPRHALGRTAPCA